MEEFFDVMIDPHPQIRFLFTGHAFDPTHQADFTTLVLASASWVVRSRQRGSGES